MARKKKEPEAKPAAESSVLPIGHVTLNGCRCRCGHEWLPRQRENPRVCPKCKSPNWDEPKRWSRMPSEAE